MTRPLQRSSTSLGLAGQCAAVLVAAGICYCLFHMPLQVNDSLDEIVEVQRDENSIASFQRALHAGHYFRPLRVMQSRMLFAAAGGQYWLTYRLFHALQVAAALILFVSLLNIRDRPGLLALPLALTVFVGHHGFLGNVKEVYPVNHFLQVLVLSLAAFEVARRARSWWGDVAAALIFTAAVLTLESGVLIWCIVVAARLTGLQGVSRRGVVVMSALLLGYVALRSAYVDLPATIANATGFGLRKLDVAELQAMFGGSPWPLYAYNVVATLLSVLFTEPRAGVWLLLFRSAGEVAPRVYIGVISSTLATGVLAWYVAPRLGDWRRRRFTEPDRLIVVFLAVLLGTAALSFAYTKDEILGVAAAFYAAATFVAVRELVVRASQWRLPVRSAILVVLLMLSVSWTVRGAGLFYNLRAQAFRHGNDWASLERLLAPSARELATPQSLELVRRLRSEGLAHPAPNPHFLPRWGEKLFDVDW